VMDVRIQARRWREQANPFSHSTSRGDEESVFGHKLVDPKLPRKASSESIW
jgi:hypothetical protein